MSNQQPLEPQRLPHVSASAARRIRALLALLQSLSPAIAAAVAFRLFLTPHRRAPDPVDAPAVGRARIHSLDIAGETIGVYEWGAGSRTAVIMHGWGSCAPRFAPLAIVLAQQGYRVVAFDAPGHGRSTGRLSSLPEFQATLVTVVQRFGPADLLIGHSLGALAVVLALGETAGAQPLARAAVLISLPSGAPFLLQRYQQMFDIREPTARHVRRRFGKRFSHPPEHFVALRVAQNLSLPLLLVHDSNDDVVPVEHSLAMAAAVPGATLQRTQQLGHSGLLRDAATINVIAEFAKLGEHSADTAPFTGSK